MKNSSPKEIHSDKNNDPEILEILFQDRMNYLRLLSSAVIYELHTPLVIIRGLAESLLKNSHLDPQANLLQISNESKNLLKILDDMTFVSSPENSIVLENISLKKTVEQVTLFFNQVCLDKRISLQVQVNPQLRIESEPRRLKSIITTLIGHAVEACDQQSKTEIKAITVYARQEQKGVSLSISDTGVGLCPLVQERILQGLFVGQETWKSDQGLRLALAQKMIRDLDIDMTFHSLQTKGSTFTLLFPRAE